LGYNPSILATFHGGSNGSAPVAGLVMDQSGNLFGTTRDGGDGGYGTVFEVQHLANGHYSNTITPLAAFHNTDGARPTDQLVMDDSGDLFGTASSGGDRAGDGTVFELKCLGNGRYSNTITPLAYFNFSTTGGQPLGGLVWVGNNLFGTTSQGGPGRYGTVFEIRSLGSGRYSSTITVLAAFNYTNGLYPAAGLIAGSSGNLFGTTEGGGTDGQGTVFEMVHARNSYTLTTLGYFPGSGVNGVHPVARLVLDHSGNLFGTAATGGGTANAGTVFEVKNLGHGHYSRTITTVVSFNGNNGAHPVAGLIVDTSDDLFGTTQSGGAHNQGTVFELAHGSNTITTLGSFGGSDHAGGPCGDLLLDHSGNLFGTTQIGGAVPGCGTVFDFIPQANNWAGNIVGPNLTSPQLGTITQVQGTWSVPAMPAAGPRNAQMTTWVGMDGYLDPAHIEQIGIGEAIVNGTPFYQAVYQMGDPHQAPTPIGVTNAGTPFTVHAHDMITASLSYSAAGFTLSITDRPASGGATETWTSPHPIAVPGAQRATAEWIVEGTASLLPNFGTVTFSQTMVNHVMGINASWQTVQVAILLGNTLEATASPLTGNSFTVTYRASAPTALRSAGSPFASMQAESGAVGLTPRPSAALGGLLNTSDPLQGTTVGQPSTPAVLKAGRGKDTVTLGAKVAKAEMHFAAADGDKSDGSDFLDRAFAQDAVSRSRSAGSPARPRRGF
jgi:uncharacterized repeat protein (TIGR03803 family)